MSNNFNKGLYETIYEHLDIHPDVKNLSLESGESKRGDKYKKFKLKNNIRKVRWHNCDQKLAKS